MVTRAGADGYVDALPGVRRRTLVHGPGTLQAEFTLAEGAVIPVHRHPQEQTGYLISGRVILTIAGVDHDLRPGDAWMIPGGVEHGARAIGASVIVEVFAPVREDYLP